MPAACILKATFLGFQLLRIVRDPLREMPKVAGPLTQSLLWTSGTSVRKRLKGVKTVIATVLSTMRDPRKDLANDPIRRARADLQSESERLQELEDKIENEINNVLASALVGKPS